MLELQWPWVLLLLPLPIFMRMINQSQSSSHTTYWQYNELFNTHEKPRLRQLSISLLLLYLAWCILIAGLSRPTWLGEPNYIPPTGRDLMVALDLSGSMQIPDMTLNEQPADRLSAAKEVLSQFIQARKGDRLGIIVFGSKAYLLAPLSFDLATINQLVQESQIGFAGEQTAIGEAIGLGIKRLQDIPAEQRVLILMTDGANTAGRVSPLQAANYAAKQGVTIHTIGIGAEQMVVQGFFGPKVVNPSSDLDEPLLTNIAELTGGQYFRARSTQELKMIYQLIEQLEPTPSEDVFQRPQTSLFHWLGLASLFTLGMSLLSSGRLTLAGKQSS
ncbi:VWA domain-containing protein [Marinomonas ostreistagni]|uniref:VWA domain-containing protein n=2 Tax=Marinomonas ostreistagni TaxID=359209 RepID=A0ABS0ZBZ4_9GAMM|nr:VWA domain-containing protein [Marinomonas ostreistagni]